MIGRDHSGHDYAHLRERWEALASKAKIGFDTIAVTPSGEPVLVLDSGRSSDGAIYVSAGVHGDECAAVWGLLHWAEQNATLLREVPTTIFPCLNPEGLIENTRNDQDGRDLNRSFSDRSIDVIAAWQDWIGQKRFSKCLHLHEDYDARGIYLYRWATPHGWAGRCWSIVPSISPSIPDPISTATRLSEVSRPKAKTRSLASSQTRMWKASNPIDCSFTTPTSPSPSRVRARGN